MRYHRSSRNCAFADHARQIAVRGGDDSHVDVDRLRAADPLDKAVLQHPQEADLRFERQFADFVQKQRAHVGPLEPALASLGRAGETAPFVAEKLRIDQLAWNRAAVDAKERPAVAVAAVVDRAGDQLLARTRLAQDQHRHVGPADHFDALHHLLQAGLFADDRLAALFASESVQQRASVGLGRFAERGQLVHPGVVIQRDGHRFLDRGQQFDVRLENRWPSSAIADRIPCDPCSPVSGVSNKSFGGSG